MRRTALVWVVPALALVTAYVELQRLGSGMVATQLQRHHDVLHGAAGSPWAYRLAWELPVDLALRLWAPTMAFFVVSFVQKTAVLALAAVVYRRLGFSDCPDNAEHCIMGVGAKVVCTSCMDERAFGGPDA